MEVKRVPKSPVGQGVDSTAHATQQETTSPERGKKRNKKNQNPNNAPAEPKNENPPAEWEQSDLSRQLLDSSKVVEMLNHSAANSTNVLTYKSKSTTQKPKLNKRC